MPIHVAMIRLVLVVVVSFVIDASPTAGQSGDVPVPEELAALDFMLGSWTVDGAFRTPDHVGADRTIWYLTSGGMTRFDGQRWTVHASGTSSLVDSILHQISERAEPYRFTNPREVSRIQDGFLVLIDDGSTSGTTLVFYDTERKAWISTALHGPSNAVTTAVAPGGSELPAFEGRGSDRRGERIFRRGYERVSDDHYRIRTDVSFDDGLTWIEDQVVQDVRRRPTKASSIP